MHSYRLSLILQYCPLLEVSYFSIYSFSEGDVVEVSFGNRKVRAVVLSKQSLKDVKFEVRSAQFKIQKILSQKNIFSYDKNFFQEVKNYAEEKLVAAGEVIWYMFEDTEPLQISNKSNEAAHIYFDNISYEKAIFNIVHKKEIYKPKVFIKKVLQGFAPSNVFLHIAYKLSDVLPTRPHLEQLEILQIFCKYVLPDSQVEIVGEEDASARKFFIDQVVNEDAEQKDKKQIKEKIISDQALGQIQESVQAGGKVFVFVLNHGYSLRLYCRDCGKHRVCPICKNPEQYIVDGEIRYTFCAHCQQKKFLNNDSLLLCDYCGSYNLNSFGLGIQKVGEYLKEKIEASIEIIDERAKKLTDKQLVKKVNDADVTVVVGTVRTLRARVGKYDTTVVVSLGKVDVENELQSMQQRILLDEIAGKSKKIYIERILSNQEEKNKGNKTFIFWENYKKNILPREKEDLITIAIPRKNIKHILPVLRDLPALSNYKKGIFVVYVFNKNQDAEVNKKLVELGRRFGDVYVGTVSREFTFTLK
jgi:hypothetical protein